MKYGLRRAVLAIAFASVPGVVGVASAQGVVFSNGGGLRADAHTMSVSPRGMGASFILPGNATLTGADIYAFFYNRDPYNPPAGQSSLFNWAFYMNGLDNKPGSLIASGYSPASPSGASQFGFNLPNVNLMGGSRLWFIVGNADPAYPNHDHAGTMYWAATYTYPDCSVLGVQGLPGAWGDIGVIDGPKQCYGEIPAFRLLGTFDTSTVPEPASLALLGTGLVGLVPIVRRRRR